MTPKPNMTVAGAMMLKGPVLSERAAGAARAEAGRCVENGDEENVMRESGKPVDWPKKGCRRAPR